MPRYPEFGSLCFDDDFINNLFAIEHEELELQRKKLIEPYGARLPFDAPQYALEFAKIQRSAPVVLRQEIENEFIKKLEVDFGNERDVAVCADVMQVCVGAKIMRPKLYVGKALFFSIEEAALNWDKFYNGDTGTLDTIPGSEIYLHLAAERHTYGDVGTLMVALSAINGIHKIA